MAGGFISSSGQDAKQYPGKMTRAVLIACVVAASSGLIFGYDIGISGGVTSMDPFLEKFFPSVYKKKQAATSDQNNYCKFDSQLLTLFTSSLYIAGLISSLVASTFSKKFGRKMSMIIGGIVFLVGAILNGAAMWVWMLIVGRILLGFGVGFGIQAAPMYLSEVAPSKRRGAMNILFQLMITIGIFIANLVNYGTNHIKGGNGWRVSLGLAAVPAIIMTLGAFWLPETPNSLIQRGNAEEAEAKLKTIRGVEDVREEFNDLIKASEEAKKVKNPWSNLVKRKYRPQFVMSLLIPFFQQLTGINVVMFYAPVLFATLGFANNASLLSAVITGGVNVVATFVSIIVADKYGRRVLFLEGGVQMLISQSIIGIVLGKQFGWTGVASISKGYAALIVIMICVYTSAFAWSWGPLAWLVPSEIFQLEIRSAGLSINASINLFMTFVIAQAFLPALCHLRYSLFFVFAIIIITMSLFVLFFVPETKNIPIENVQKIWKEHWFWRRFVSDDDESPRMEEEA